LLNHLTVKLLLLEKVRPTQRALTKVNHKVTQRTMLIHDLPQTRCVLRCRVKLSFSEPGNMCVCYVLSADLYTQVRRRYTRLLTEALVNQLILRLIKCPDYPQPPKRGTSETVHYIRMTLLRLPCSSHRLIAGCFDTSSMDWTRPHLTHQPIHISGSKLFVSGPSSLYKVPPRAATVHILAS
jgi:hypothetical protein